jgi:hypothetical protein
MIPLASASQIQGKIAENAENPKLTQDQGKAGR